MRVSQETGLKQINGNAPGCGRIRWAYFYRTIASRVPFLLSDSSAARNELLLIAGTQSGCGKTTVTLALMQYLRALNLSVAPFKAGPDFLDPMWHAVVCGKTSYNLDTRMMGEESCRDLFAEQSASADVCVIEGVMGLFDGAKGVGGEGSSAHLAKALNESVLLVVNAKGMSGSIVALVEGFVARCENITGIIANRVGSENHARILRELLVEFELPPLIAWMGKGAPQLPERHLGLKMPGELDLPDFSESFHVEKDFFTADPLGSVSCFAIHLQPQRTQSFAGENNRQRLRGKKIAIAKDVAFCFVYSANIEWLVSEGAEIFYFSPLAGEEMPENVDVMWLPGGYPELHLEALSQSPSLISMRDFIESGNPVLAECGGMMVLGESINGVAMAAMLPCSFKMQDKLAGLGYREDSSGVRGHEFHHSKREGGSYSPAAFQVQRGDAGIRYKNLRASYIHWYFSSQPEEVTSWFTH